MLALLLFGALVVIGLLEVVRISYKPTTLKK